MTNPGEPLAAPRQTEYWARVTLVFTLVGPLVGYILNWLQARLFQDTTSSIVEYLLGFQATLALVPFAYLLGGLAAFCAAQFHLLGMRVFRARANQPGFAPLIGALAGFAGLFFSYVAWNSGVEGFLESMETRWVGVPAATVCALICRKRGFIASAPAAA
ncbi:MAG: hypothetical protein RL030_1385 [Pseudomonadota bacterium]